jgi:hypothetical protein
MTSEGAAIAGIRQCLDESMRCAKEKDKDQAARNGMPLHLENELYIHVPKILRYLNQHTAQKWSNVEFINAIRQAGFCRCNVHYESEGGRTTKSYWKCEDSRFKDLLSKPSASSG